MEVGVAYRDVTPPLGTALRGYYVERIADSIHDPLQVKAMVTWDGEHFFVLVVVDIIDVSPDAYQRAREHISQQWEIPMDFITIASTHTHTGPFLTEDYDKVLFEAIVAAVEDARKNRISVVMKVGATEIHNISFNRRYFMKDGSVKFNPGVLNPDIVKPAGPIEPELGIVVFENSEGKPHAIIVNFAIHLDTIGGTAISADFPYFLEQELRTHFTEDTAVVFAIGACGNINHIDVSREDRLKSFERSAQIGHVLAQKLVENYPDLVEIDSPRIAARTRRLVLRTPVYSDDIIRQASIDAVMQSDDEASTPVIREARKILRVAKLEGRGLQAEVQIVVLGSTALVMLPTEVFVELGLAIKRNSPFEHTFVITFTNHSVGYIPDQPAFAHGAYEVEVSMIEAGQGEVLVETAVRLLNELFEEVFH